MDAEFWSARVKQQQVAEPARFSTDGYRSLEDLEEDEKMLDDFACPFCYKDFNIGSLCHHIEDEHFFKGSHRYVLSVGLKLGRTWLGIPLFSMVICSRYLIFHVELNQELRKEQLQYLLGRASSHAVVTSSIAVPDPLISSFIYTLPVYEAEKQLQPSLSTEESLAKNCL